MQSLCLGCTAWNTFEWPLNWRKPWEIYGPALFSVKKVAFIRKGGRAMTSRSKWCQHLRCKWCQHVRCKWCQNMWIFELFLTYLYIINNVWWWMGEVLVTWASKIVKEMLYNIYVNTAMIKVLGKFDPLKGWKCEEREILNVRERL